MTKKILIQSGDHSYREAIIETAKVVYNAKTRTYSEFIGEEWLEEGDVVVEREVAC